MKFPGIPSLLPMSAILLVFFITCFSAMAVEKSEYRIVENDKGFEIREYPPQVVAETLVEGPFEDAGNQGFRRLFDYISGNNRSGPAIQMTAPVTQEGLSKNSVWRDKSNQKAATCLA